MQTMLTVVTQNSRLLRRSAFYDGRMAFGFGYPHCSVPDARCQVIPRPLMYNIVRVGDSLSVAFVSRTSKSKTEIAAPSVPERAQRLALFGPPPVIEGEDAAAYDQLLARICAAVKPVDVIYEITQPILCPWSGRSCGTAA